jgi:hypothetical protein
MGKEIPNLSGGEEEGRGLTDQALSCRPPVKVPCPDRRAPAESTPNRAAAGWSTRQADQAAAGPLQCLVRRRATTGACWGE